MLAGLYGLVNARFVQSRDSRWLIASLATVVLFHAGYIVLMPAGLKPFFFSAILIGAALWPGRLVFMGKDEVFLFPQLALAAILLIEYLSLVRNLWAGGMAPISAFLALASLWAVIVRVRVQASAISYWVRCISWPCWLSIV